MAGPDALALWTPIRTRGEDMTTVAEFTVAEGEHIPFVLTWYPSNEEPPRPVDARFAIHDTESWWQEWVDTCTYQGQWRDAVVRSLITLKALTYNPSGGIVAAATTSLPETLGGERNWDYRYCWLRDATLTLEALMRGGFHDEALAWSDWLLRAVAGDVTKLQIMYGPAGERRLDEWEVDWLAGYEGSKPVRVGNAASGQFQLDVYGEVLSALYEACDGGWPAVGHGVGPAEGAGPVRRRPLGPARRGHLGGARPPPPLHPLQGHGLGGRRPGGADHRRVRPRGPPRGLARRCATKIHDEVCTQGYNEKVGAFTQYYGSDALDASLLMMPLVGFLPATDPRVRSTIEAIERDLTEDGFVLRYRTEDTGAVDGLSGHEGAFLACSFWMADCLHLIGRHDDAMALLDRLVGLPNDLGLLAEEYDVRRRSPGGELPAGVLARLARQRGLQPHRPSLHGGPGRPGGRRWGPPGRAPVAPVTARAGPGAGPTAAGRWPHRSGARRAAPPSRKERKRTT